MGNAPRMDPQDLHGYVTDVAINRHIRNYVQAAYAGKPGMEMLIRSASNINTGIARAKELAQVELSAKGRNEVYAGRKAACQLFYDVRTFGAVMSTGPNAGRVRDRSADLCPVSGPHSAPGHFHHADGQGRGGEECQNSRRL
ncbi:MAG: type I CRISPR-associated protein Cas7 [Oscillospiraceae bacterium]